MDNIVDFLEQEQPDILVTQETLRCDDADAPARFHSIEAIQERLHFTACEFAPALIDNDDGYRVHSGNATFSRFPITAQRIIAYTPFAERTEHTPETFANTPRNLQHTVIAAAGTRFNILNTQGVWDLDGDRPSEARQAMCRSIADTAQGLEHVILAGDTNLKPTNAALRPVDELLRTVFGDELQTSFNVRRKDLQRFPGYASAVVDLMYISPDLRAVSHDCPDVDISDHLPLVATIETID